jgi:hypothetical protein
MTVLAASIGRGGLLFPLVSSRGVSGAADDLDQLISGTCRSLAESIAVRRTAELAIAELKRVQEEASSRNWDGYGALPINPDSFEQAVRFLRALPTTTPVPNVGVDPDGEVDLLWHQNSSRTLSVSVGPTGRLTYAALLGAAQAYGTEWLSNEIPQPILSNLSRVLDPNS